MEGGMKDRIRITARNIETGRVNLEVDADVAVLGVLRADGGKPYANGMDPAHTESFTYGRASSVELGMTLGSLLGDSARQVAENIVETHYSDEPEGKKSFRARKLAARCIAVAILEAANCAELTAEEIEEQEKGAAKNVQDMTVD